MRYYAGLDVGGTSGRVLFAKEDGTEIGQYEGIGCAFNTDGPVLGREKYTVLMQEALRAYLLAPEDCGGICTAASGVDSLQQEQDLADIFAALGFSRDRTMVLNDCEVFLHLTEEPSLVVISGTGSVCYGRNRRGHVFRTGGWNHVLSDEGSAFWIGLQAIRAAGETMDGRRQAEKLTAAVQEACGFRTLEKADVFVTQHLTDKRRIGRLSGLVGDLAAQGDAESVRILQEAADQVFALVRDTAVRMEADDGPAGTRTGAAGMEADDSSTGAQAAASGMETDGSCANAAGEKKSTPDSPVKLWLWGSVCVKNPVFRTRLVERTARELPGLSPDIPEQTALQTALRTAIRAFPLH